MKLKASLAASLFAVMTALSFNASVAADTPADAKAEKALPEKKMKPHSHVEEKTGIPQKAPMAMADKPNAAKDKTKHFHPRDGK
jgi:hypothetical protein